jgi:hypothetical protein
VKVTFKKFVLVCWGGIVLTWAGFTGPQYPRHQVVLFGKDAPAITGPHDPAIPQHLSTNAWAKANFPERAAGIGVTPFKAMGVQGWTDYHLHARARGHVVQHEVSSSGFRTVDLQLISLTVDRVSIHWKGTRFMRVEIFLGKVPEPSALFDNTNAVLFVEGKLVWDEDGWFEIHPQRSRDVHQESKRKWWQWW